MSSRTRRRASVSLLVLLIFLTQPALIRAANALDVVINEVAWMGTTASAYHEWIELYNTTGAAINLTGWTLSAADGTPTITLTGSIPAYGHYLLERSDDDPVPGVAADLTYTGVMSNEGEDLHLFDASAALIDQVDASAGWFAGHAAGRVPMARYDPLLPGSADNWTYAPRCGTPTNSVDISHTCALTVTYTGADLDYAVYFNPLFLTATTITTTTTPMESALLTLIDTTASTLDAAIYGLNWQSVIEALIAAHQRGVTVRIVGDDDAATTSYNAGYQALTAAGIPLVIDSSSYIQHNKFIIVDGIVVWTGSTNLTDTGFTLNANNSLAITSTHLADIYTAQFEQMWAGHFHNDKTGAAHLLDYNGTLVEIYFSPRDLAPFAVWELLDGVTDTLHFAHFFWTDNMLSDRAIARLEAGVNIAGVWDQLGVANAYAVADDLTAAGARVRVEDVPGKLHHKLAVIDAYGADPIVITGSYNWMNAGGFENDENTLIIHHADLAQAYHAEIDAIWTAIDPTPVTITALSATSTWGLFLLPLVALLIWLKPPRP